MTTPEQLYADPKWRRRNSVYCGWGLAFGFGFAGFLYIGIRSHKTKWIIWGAVYGILSVASLAIAGSLTPADADEPRPVIDTVLSLIWFGTWVASAIHLFRTRREWLWWKAWTRAASHPVVAAPPLASTGYPDPTFAALGVTDPTAEYLAAPAASPVPIAAPPPPSGPVIDDGPMSQQPPPPSVEHGFVDLNTASIETIAAIPGFGIVAARRLLDERARRGGFATVDEAAVAAGVSPHVRAKLPQVAHVTTVRQASEPHPRGRMLDI